MTATLHSHKWHGTGHYVQQRIIYFIHSGYLLNNIHLYTNMYIYIEREGLYLYANQQNNNNNFSTSTARVKCTKTNNITCDFFSFSWAGNIFCGAVEQVCHSVCYPCCRTCKHRALSLHLRTHEASSSCLTCLKMCEKLQPLQCPRCSEMSLIVGATRAMMGYVNSSMFRAWGTSLQFQLIIEFTVDIVTYINVI